MSDYLVEIGPGNSLAQITLQVQGEEAGASEFKDSSISFYAGRVTNLARFTELAPGTMPQPITFVVNDAALPAGASSAWAGVMMVGGTTIAVKAYRT